MDYAAGASCRYKKKVTNVAPRRRLPPLCPHKAYITSAPVTGHEMYKKYINLRRADTREPPYGRVAHDIRHVKYALKLDALLVGREDRKPLLLLVSPPSESARRSVARRAFSRVTRI